MSAERFTNDALHMTLYDVEKRLRIPSDNYLNIQDNHYTTDKWREPTQNLKAFEGQTSAYSLYLAFGDTLAPPYVQILCFLCLGR
jgi:hypothetical protein